MNRSMAAGPASAVVHFKCSGFVATGITPGRQMGNARAGASSTLSESACLWRWISGRVGRGPGCGFLWPSGW